jgi:hypothetical protein
MGCTKLQSAWKIGDRLEWVSGTPLHYGTKEGIRLRTRGQSGIVWRVLDCGCMAVRWDDGVNTIVDHLDVEAGKVERIG